MIPKLTDFTYEELIWIVSVMRAELDKEESHAFSMAGLFNAPPHTEYHICSQWLTKLTEAMQIVKDRETTNQN